MKKAKLLLCVIAVISLFGSCKKKEDDKPAAPVADFSFTGDSVLIPATVTFTDKSKDAKSYLWDFGDSATATEKDPVHIYNSAGSFVVKLTATGDGGDNSVTKTVTVFSNAKNTVSITSLMVLYLPWLDSNGTPFNSTSPKYIYRIFDSDNNVVAPLNFVTRSYNTFNVPFSFGTPNNPTPVISNLNKNSRVDFECGDCSPVRLISSIVFNPRLFISGANPYPTMVELSKDSARVRLSLQWN